jgi:general stress protein CsbA
MRVFTTSPGSGRIPSKTEGRRQIRRYSLPGFLCALLLGCSNYEEAKQRTEIQKAARTFLDGMNASSSAEDQSTWELNQFFMFGPPFIWLTDIETIALPSPDAYEATAEVWYRGRTATGESISGQRKIVMSVKQEAASNWRVINYKLGEPSPLSFWKQFVYWLWWSYGGPCFVWFCILVPCFSWVTSEHAVALIFLVFLIGAVIWSGILSYYCFGSGLAVVACVPFFLIVNLFFYSGYG